MPNTAHEITANGRAPDPPTMFAPRLGPDGEACASCGAPLAADQRYCLSCGTRRAGLRVPFPVAAAAPVPAAPVATTTTVRMPPRRLGLEPAAGIAVAAALALGLMIGALVALIAGGDDTPAPVAAVATATPVAAAATPAPTVAASAIPTVAATFVSDWPAGQEGWVVQLRTLPKDGTTPEAVAAAKADLTSQGAAGVGALDSDEYPSLDGGNYVLYSGNYSSKADAEGAVDTAKFPDAKAVQVSATAQETSTPEPAETPTPTPTAAFKSPEDAQKKLRDAPDTTESTGKKAKPDNKAPGGGSETTDFG